MCFYKTSAKFTVFVEKRKATNLTGKFFVRLKSPLLSSANKVAAALLHLVEAENFFTLRKC